MWKIGPVQAQYSFKGDGFLGLTTLWKGNLCYFINVYSSSIFIGREKCGMVRVLHRGMDTRGCFN